MLKKKKAEIINSSVWSVACSCYYSMHGWRRRRECSIMASLWDEPTSCQRMMARLQSGKEGLFEIWKCVFSITHALFLPTLNMFLRHCISLFFFFYFGANYSPDYTLPLFAYKSLLCQGILLPFRSWNQHISHQHTSLSFGI